MSTPIMTLTDAAVTRVNQIMSEKDKPALGLKIGVRGGGCSGFTYTLEYAYEVEKLDEVIEKDGVTVLIDSNAVMFLIGTEMDFVTDKMKSGFVFKNPNEKSRCGCGESFHV
jgi:iron-sulfur cluster assembly protein